MDYNKEKQTEIKSALNNLLDYRDVPPSMLSTLIISKTSRIDSIISGSVLLPAPKFEFGDQVTCIVYEKDNYDDPGYRKFNGTILDISSYNFFARQYEYVVEITDDDDDISKFLDDKYPAIFESALEKI